jgi:hypothetical protein
MFLFGMNIGVGAGIECRPTFTIQNHGVSERRKKRAELSFRHVMDCMNGHGKNWEVGIEYL